MMEEMSETEHPKIPFGRYLSRMFCSLSKVSLGWKIKSITKWWNLC